MSPSLDDMLGKFSEALDRLQGAQQRVESYKEELIAAKTNHRRARNRYEAAASERAVNERLARIYGTYDPEKALERKTKEQAALAGIAEFLPLVERCEGRLRTSQQEVERMMVLVRSLHASIRVEMRVLATSPHHGVRDSREDQHGKPVQTPAHMTAKSPKKPAARSIKFDESGAILPSLDDFRAEEWERLQKLARPWL